MRNSDEAGRKFLQENRALRRAVASDGTTLVRPFEQISKMVERELDAISAMMVYLTVSI